MKKLLERMDDATARMEQVICIAGAISGVSLSNPLCDLLEEEDDDGLVKIFDNIPRWLLEALNGRRYEWEDAFIEWAVQSNHLGFLIQFATPVMRHHGSRSSYSWGYYSTCWIYADTFDAAVDAGLSWVEERRQAEKEKAQAEQNEAEES